MQFKACNLPGQLQADRGSFAELHVLLAPGSALLCMLRMRVTTPGGMHDVKVTGAVMFCTRTHRASPSQIRLLCTDSKPEVVQPYDLTLQ